MHEREHFHTRVLNTGSNVLWALLPFRASFSLSPSSPFILFVFFPSLLLFFLFVLRPTLSQWDCDRAYDQFRAYPLGMSFKKKKKNPPCRFSSSAEQTNSRRYRSTSCKSDRGTVRIYIQEIVFVICTSGTASFFDFMFANLFFVCATRTRCWSWTSCRPWASLLCA